MTASFAVKGSLAATAAIGVVGLVLSLRGRHDWRSGTAFFLMYLGFYVVLLVL